MTRGAVRELVLATSNRNKAAEFVRLLSAIPVEVRTLAEFPGVTAVAEIGTTLAENARRKANGYAAQLRRWVLCDDTGLEVAGLGGAPGVRSARFAGERATMAENRARLLDVTKDLPNGQRAARFVCCLALADDTGRIVAEATGTCAGTIRDVPVGSSGFGYDTLFEVAELGCALAECDAAQTDEFGHRGRAVRALLEIWRP